MAGCVFFILVEGRTPRGGMGGRERLGLKHMVEVLFPHCLNEGKKDIVFIRLCLFLLLHLYSPKFLQFMFYPRIEKKGQKHQRKEKHAKYRSSYLWRP